MPETSQSPPTPSTGPRWKQWLKVLLALATLSGVAGLFLAFGPPQLLAKTESAEFCQSCHVMQSQYEAWFHTGAHRSIACVDCHLPHQNKGLYYTWKTIDGMKDAYAFYSGNVPEYIRLSGHGQKTVQQNCIRCHEGRVAMINQERSCWECHRFVQHHLAGARQTQ